MRTNQEYKNAALSALKGSWTRAVLVAFVALFVSELTNLASWGIDRMAQLGNVYDEPWVFPLLMCLSVGLMLAFLLFLVYPMTVGLANVFSRLYYNSERDLLMSFRHLTFEDCTRSAFGMFLMSAVTLGYSLLLIVPGVIASLALFLTPFLLKDYPELSVTEALRMSRKMMQGHKMQLFKLQLSFLGWVVLNVFTLGLGTLWLLPYMLTTMAAFYQDVREQYIMKEGQQESAS